ncbi:MAG TPA: zinc transporter ZupT [Elusimicrobiota bacterium]|nr:zinc transporter ZupT [Elusimicrobiota bacterium]
MTFHPNVLLAFGMTLLAGLSTGIGSALAFFARRTNAKFLCLSLGFSAGVMIYVSFVEIFVKSKTALTVSLGSFGGYAASTASFFAGLLLIAAIDRIIPPFENPHELRSSDEPPPPDAARPGLYRMGLFSALAIGLHNFPEGLATFVSALKDPLLGIPIMVAIAIHNIPEGIAVSIPVFYSTGSKRKAFLLSFLSGLAEPVGAGIGFLFLMPFLSDALFGVVYGVVAGIMVFISLDELLPTAEKYGEHHLAIYGLTGGMAVMAISLLAFAR